jgi:hypothetical protein
VLDVQVTCARTGLATVRISAIVDAYFRLIADGISA